MNVRKFLIASVAVVALALPASASADWTSNTFRSPTGNLICKLRPSQGRISCGSFASQKVIVMGTNSRPVQGFSITWNGSENWPVLRYGQRYNVGQPISCTSLFSGMKCQNATGWFFKIERQTIWVGRYGQTLYTL